MTDTPEGFTRGEDGILYYSGSFAIRNRYSDPGEACKFWNAGKLKLGCTEAIHDGFWSRSCDKIPKHDPDHNGNPTKCGIHSSAAKAKRKAKSDAKFNAWRDKSNWNSEMRKLNEERDSIIHRIACGYNDPRGLCADWLDRKEKLEAQRPG